MARQATYNPLELNFKPMFASTWRAWSQSWWRTGIERRTNQQWLKGYPSPAEWSRRLGVSRTSIWRWANFGVSNGHACGWTMLFHEIEADRSRSRMGTVEIGDGVFEDEAAPPIWYEVDSSPMCAEELRLAIDLVGSASALSRALHLSESKASNWLQTAVPTRGGYSALLRWLIDDMDLRASPPSVSVVNGVKIPQSVHDHIRRLAITDVPSRVIAMRTGVSHTTVLNKLKDDD